LDKNQINKGTFRISSQSQIKHLLLRKNVKICLRSFKVQTLKPCLNKCRTISLTASNKRRTCLTNSRTQPSTITKIFIKDSIKLLRHSKHYERKIKSWNLKLRAWGKVLRIAKKLLKMNMKRGYNQDKMISLTWRTCSRNFNWRMKF